MRPSCSKAAHQAVRAAGQQQGVTPYAWINPAKAGPSSGPLAGRAIAIKDNISCRDAPTSCSSSMLRGDLFSYPRTPPDDADYYPPYNATCVDSLIRAGAHIVGQTKMDEFGMGSQTTHLPSFLGSVHNPAAPTPDEPPRVAGGSSGGSAATVAEGSCWTALGTDTGGSVRLPASYCGVVGLKPSYGMISRHGVISYADSLDCVGVLGSSIAAVKQTFDIISHPDARDMTCSSTSIRSSASSMTSSFLSSLPSTCSRPLANVRIGLPVQTHLPLPHLSLPARLLMALQDLGATLHSLDLPSFRMALPAYYVLASAEASSNLARYGGGWFGSPHERAKRDGSEVALESGEEKRRRLRSEGLGREVKKRILAGTHALSANEFNNTYLKALHLRRTLRNEFARSFRHVHPLVSALQNGKTSSDKGIDLLLHPTAIRTAPLHPDALPHLPRQSQTGAESGDGVKQQDSEYLQDMLTVPASLAGLPSMSVPAGRAEDGWPFGVSITGQWGMEEAVFLLGREVEKWASTGQ